MSLSSTNATYPVPEPPTPCPGMRYIFRHRCHRLAVMMDGATWELARMTLSHILDVNKERLRILANGAEVSDATTPLADIGSAELTVEVPDIKYKTAPYHKLMRNSRGYKDSHPVDEHQPPAKKKPRVAPVMKKPGCHWDNQFNLGKSSVHIAAESSSKEDSSNSDDTSSSVSDASAIYANKDISTVPDATGGSVQDGEGKTVPDATSMQALQRSIS